MIGFDVEWQPAFSFQEVKAAVLQIAAKEKIFLIDIYNLRETHKKESHQTVSQLVRTVFSNEKVLKLGYSMNEDLVRKSTNIYFKFLGTVQYLYL